MNNKNIRVMLLEDNHLIQTINKRLLEDLGCQVDIASTGLEALSLSKNCYDLVFVDIDLPDINGITVARAIRSEEALGRCQRNSVLIALTAGNENLREICFSAGINDFHSKPANVNTLKEILHRWIN